VSVVHIGYGGGLLRSRDRMKVGGKRIKRNRGTRTPFGELVRRL